MSMIQTNDAIHLARAAKIVRRDMLKMKNDFSGSFDAEVSASFPLGISFHGPVWHKHHNPDQFCSYASTSSHSLTATHVQLFGTPEEDCHHD